MDDLKWERPDDGAHAMEGIDDGTEELGKTHSRMFAYTSDSAALEACDIAIHLALDEPARAPNRLGWQWRRLLRTPLFWSGGLLLLFLLLFAFLGPVLDRSGVVTTYNVAQQNMPPSPAHILGTDVLGRDVLGALMVGGQIPILSGFAAGFAASFLGIFAGIVAGYAGGAADSAIMRVTDLFLSIPQIVPVMLIESLIGASTGSLIVVVALTAWPSTARIIRTRALAVRSLPYIEAARAGGVRPGAIIRRHVLPNVFDEIVSATAHQFGNVVLVMAIVTFLGLGMAPPWNWASMFAENIPYFVSGDWWLVLPSGLLFSALIVSVFWLGEAVRMAFNPQESAEGS
jgi:peptide/nickel transport system permease protein